jgi:PQQ-like domain
MKQNGFFARQYPERHSSRKSAFCGMLFVLLGGTGLLAWQQLAVSAGGGSHASGSLLWENPAATFMNALATGQGKGSGRVFTAGAVVQAFDAGTGELSWTSGAGDYRGLVAGPLHVYAAGLTTDAFPNFDFLVEAFDPDSGNRIWQDRFDLAGGGDLVNSIALGNMKVFAGGLATTASGALNWLVRGHDAQNGSLLWQDLSDRGSRVQGITAESGRLYAAGIGSITGEDFLVRAYDANSGALLWEDVFSEGTFDEAIAIAAGGGRVYVAGVTLAGFFGPNEWVVRTYDAPTGRLLWQDHLSLGGKSSQPFSVLQDNNQVFVVGQVENIAGNMDFLVRAYDPRNGQLLWQNTFGFAGGYDSAQSITTEQGRLFVGGTAIDQLGNVFSVVRAYERQTGSLLWQDQFDQGGIVLGPYLASAAGRVFAGKTILRAYSAR